MLNTITYLGSLQYKQYDLSLSLTVDFLDIGIRLSGISKMFNLPHRLIFTNMHNGSQERLILDLCLYFVPLLYTLTHMLRIALANMTIKHRRKISCRFCGTVRIPPLSSKSKRRRMLLRQPFLRSRIKYRFQRHPQRVSKCVHHPMLWLLYLPEWISTFIISCYRADDAM